MDVNKRMTMCAAALTALAIAGCGGGSSGDKPASASAGGAGAIQVTLGKPDEFMLTLSSAQAKSGSVKFHVTNMGTTDHEMIVVPLPSGAAPAVLAEPGTGKANETTSLGEVGSTPVGKSGDVTLDLKAGKYALLCNEPGHFAGGMYTTLTVS
jgi:uncharacterized cupredoxin-like copper-binding protein